MEFLTPAIATVVAYLIGSLSFAVVVSRLMGLQDPRTYGSKNPGATNVLRSGNKAAAVITLLLDALKGWLPVVLVQQYGAAYGLGDATLALVGPDHNRAARPEYRSARPALPEVHDHTEPPAHRTSPAPPAAGKDRGRCPMAPPR